jgi:cytochrome c-type biogenesis protein CcmE
MSKKTTRVVLSGVILVGAFTLLMVSSLRESVEYFKEVDEVMPQAAAWYNKPLQLHGFVVEGSIERRKNTLDYRFKVKNGESEVTSTYTGVVPDTFKDGAEVVLKGRLSPAGFEASNVVAKCPSKYVPTDGAVPANYTPPAQPKQSVAATATTGAAN